MKQVGLTLSKVRVRDFTHIRVLNSLKEKFLNPEIISQTSIGAILVAVFPSGYSTDDMQNWLPIEICLTKIWKGF